MDTKIHEVAAGIYQIYLPLPMRPSIVNVYLVRGGDEWTLIDTGMHSEESIATFKQAVRVSCAWIISEAALKNSPMFLGTPSMNASLDKKPPATRSTRCARCMPKCPMRSSIS